MAGVQCAGKPHFWVNADGTYQEEGQKTVKGKIWDKVNLGFVLCRCLVTLGKETNQLQFVCVSYQPIVKLLSPVLSLPTPNKTANQCGEEVVHMVNRPIPDYLEHRTIQKLLLVGSGASTILKQVKMFINIDKLIGCTCITIQLHLNIRERGYHLALWLLIPCNICNIYMIINF